MLFYTPFWNLIIQSLKDVILYLYSHQSVVDNSLRRLRRRGAALYIDCYIILLYPATPPSGNGPFIDLLLWREYITIFTPF